MVKLNEMKAADTIAEAKKVSKIQKGKILVGSSRCLFEMTL